MGQTTLIYIFNTQGLGIAMCGMKYLCCLVTCVHKLLTLFSPCFSLALNGWYPSRLC